MSFSRKYACKKCGATKTINSHPTQTEFQFKQALPKDVLCGWRECTGRAIPSNN